MTSKTCNKCSQNFVLSESDELFYQKLEVPIPNFCHDCRAQKRLAFRNERKLYHRKCDLCKKEIISMYSADSKYTVYCQQCWWSDKWDAAQHGKDFDFTRPFFEQFNELMLSVPRISLMNKEPENAEYCNFAWRNKNCYLLFTSWNNEDSYYSKRCHSSKDICDSSNSGNCELCYEVIDSTKCYNCAWLQNSSECSDCTIGYNLKNCKNCFACYNLVNKSFCIYNEQYTEAEYSQKLVTLKKNLAAEIEKFLGNKNITRKYMDTINTENCTGDAIYNSKNALFCFDSVKIEDCKFISDATELKDSYDINNDDHSELAYEGIGGESNYFVRFFDICWWNKYLTYCSLCFNSQYLFGCTGMKRGEYSILNKKYSKDEYEKLVAQITDYMKKTGEWGEFFAPDISPFAYNESTAQDYYPLTKETSATWRDEDENSTYQGQKITVPDNIDEVDEGITKQILTCEVTGKLYKITPQELKFHKGIGIPLPKRCFEQRFNDRMLRKNPRKLYNRNCDNCGNSMETPYSPDRSERILCETCFLKEIY